MSHSSSDGLCQIHVISHPTTNLPFQVEDVTKSAEFFEQVSAVMKPYHETIANLHHSTRVPPKLVTSPDSTTAYSICVSVSSASV
jgi:hypothetical protein